MTPSEVWPADDSGQHQQPTIPTVTAKAKRQLLEDAQIRADQAEAAILLSHGCTPQQAMAIMEAGAPPPLTEADLVQDAVLPDGAQQVLDSLRNGQQRAAENPEAWAEASRINRMLQLAADRAAGRDTKVSDLKLSTAEDHEGSAPGHRAADQAPPKRRRRPPPNTVSYI